MDKIENKNLKINILESGDIHSITYKNDNINLYNGNIFSGSIQNIYLKLEINNKIYITRLLGINSNSSYYYKDNKAYYYGSYKNVKYEVIIFIKNYTWFYQVTLKNKKGIKANLYYGQDISLNAINNNESYICQYLEHSFIKDINGYHVITKQNLGPNYLIQQGSISNNVSFSTDAFQFFKTGYKFDNQIYGILNDNLDNEIYQYEFSYIALKSEEYDLSNNDIECVFYASFCNDFNSLEENNLIKLSKIYNEYKKENFIENNKKFFKILKPVVNYNNCLLQEHPIIKKIENMDEIEEHEGIILSYFDSDSRHFINPKKEIYQERPSGNIIISNGFKKIDDKTLTTTNYIYGIFNSDLAIGNTNFNKFISVAKDPLNLVKNKGERIFIKYKNEYKLLQMPYLYEVDINESKWVYKIYDDDLIITSTIDYDGNLILTSIVSKKNRKYDFYITIELEKSNITNKNNLDIINLLNTRYEDYKLGLLLTCDGKKERVKSNIFFSDNIIRDENNINLLIYKIDNSSKIDLYHFAFTSNTTDFNIKNIKKKTRNELLYLYQVNFINNINHFKILKSGNNKLLKFNHIIKWYTHNALIHYASPHGLEQYNGAAWGTRDVMQGPIELFETFKNYDIVKDIILKVYSHQFYDNYDWPQWFMFDKYYDIYSNESHADIIIWTLRSLTNYIISTNDFNILKEKVPYFDRKTNKFTINQYPIIEHIKNQIETIKSRFIKDTYIYSYGFGDWNDSLQPIDDNFRKRLSSGWTQLLLTETIKNLSKILKEYKKLSNSLELTYQNYFIKNNIPAGFIEVKPDKIEYLFHPLDKKTNINYRLLVFNRGMISEIFNKNDLKEYLEIIDNNLMFFDGVRLFDKPIKYNSSPKIFLRAEVATNFGREIGLNYVHAHIRYIEAMLKINASNRAYKALKQVLPININNEIKNSIFRQSNTYFSSSDACFLNRIDAENNFYKLKNNEKYVKGGWRIYSSGPGIYLKQLIENFLGVKKYDNSLYIDPVLPSELSKTEVSFFYDNKFIKIIYINDKNMNNKKLYLNDILLTSNLNINEYRKSGYLIPNKLLKSDNLIKVYY